MTGPTRTESSNHRVDPLDAANNPPRPPNAWILYRSDKLKSMPPPPPGMPRRPQADISKTISLMWKSEPADVRSHYERLSDIKKAEHQARYPGYRFQPMKKADKDRLKAEKQAEKDRERITRQAKTKTRTGGPKVPPPLFTTTARRGPASSSSSSSAASTPSVALLPAPAAAHPTPPADYPTPPAVPPATPPQYPSPPSTTVPPPPLAAPRPGMPQRVPQVADWQPPMLSQPDEPDFSPQWMDQASLPDPCGHAGTQQVSVCRPRVDTLLTDAQQEYLTVPLPSHPLQHPLGWSPDDPSPFPDLPFYPGEPLHAVMSATDDPNVFSLTDFDDLFDGTRELEVSMGPNMMPSSLLDMSQYTAFTNNLFFDLDAQVQAQFPPPGAGASTGTPFDPQPQLAGFGAFAFDGALELDERQPFEVQGGGGVAPHDTEACAPQPSTPQDASSAYAPPAGASNAGARRVAADWRHIRLTPEPEPTWSGQGR